MKRSLFRFLLSASFAALLGSTASASQASAPAAGRTQAVWTRRMLKLVFIGSGTHYSCYYLNDYVRHILLELGARKEGLTIHPVACGAGRPPSVAGTFYVLQPASNPVASQPGNVARTLTAHWARVRVSFNDPSERVLDVTGKCELVRTVFDEVVPLFPLRNARLAPGCTTYAASTNAAALQAEVLRPGA